MVIKVLQTLAEYGHFNLQIAIIITKKMLVFEIKHSDLVVSKDVDSLESRLKVLTCVGLFYVQITLIKGILSN